MDLLGHSTDAKFIHVILQDYFCLCFLVAGLYKDRLPLQLERLPDKSLSACGVL